MWVCYVVQSYVEQMHCVRICLSRSQVIFQYTGNYIPLPLMNKVYGFLNL